jgi:alpha-amylase
MDFGALKLCDFNGILGWIGSTQILAFDGWLLDFAKGYSANIAKTYVQNASPSFVVAEIWSSISYNGDCKPSPNQDHDRQELVDWA